MGNTKDPFLIIAKVINFYGIDINKPVKDGISLIHLLATCPLEKERVAFLALPGIDFTAKTLRGHTVQDLALLAADKKNREDIEYVSDVFINQFFPNIKVTIVPTIQEIVMLCNFYGIDINKTIDNGIAPIHGVAIALFEGAYLQFVFDFPGINLEAKTSRGHTALDIANLVENAEFAKLMKEALAKQKQL